MSFLEATEEFKQFFFFFYKSCSTHK